MEEFEAHLAAVTKKGANIVPGAIMGVVDSQGQFARSVSSRTSHADARQLPLQEDRRIRWRD
jgi:hypothetical protein